MTVLTGLLKFYFELETKYYKLCDSVEKKGVQIYEYFVNPVEGKGVPSFPVAVLVLLLLTALLVWFTFLSSAVSSLSLHVQVTNREGQPLQGAGIKVLDSANRPIVQGAANETGEISFGNVRGAILVSASAEGYQTLRRPISPGIISMRLSPVEQRTAGQGQQPASQTHTDVHSFLALEQTGSIEAKLSDVATGQEIDGAVQLFDAATDTLVSEVQTVQGIAVFENLELNQHVYFSASVAGYSAPARVEKLVTRTRQRVEIQLQSLAAASGAGVQNVTFNVLSAVDRRQLAGAEAGVYTDENVLVANFTTTSLPASFALQQGRRFYFNARKQGYAAAVSTYFFANQSNQTLLLQPPDGGNANVSSLRVNVKDEYNSSLAAMAAVYTTDGRLIVQSVAPNSRHEFLLQRGLAIRVKASKGDRTAQASLTLAGAVQDLLLNLEVKFAYLSITARNILTGEEIVARAEVQRDGSILSTCEGTPCNLIVKTRGVHELKVSADGYFDYLFTFGAEQDQAVFVENSTTIVNATLMPLSGVRDSQVILDGVYDAATFQKVAEGSALTRNRLYLAALRGFYLNATTASSFFSPSDSDPDNQRIVNFTPYPGLEDVEAVASELSSPDECGSSFNSGAKWRRIILNIPSAPGEEKTQNFAYFFAAEQKTVDPGPNLTLRYKSFIRRPDSSVIRNPYDALLGTSAGENSGARSECIAQSFSANYTLISPNDAENQLGKISLYFTQSRNLGLLAQSPGPEKCGKDAYDPASPSNPFEFVDCNGFPVDSGFSQTLQLHFNILLNEESSAGSVKLNVNPALLGIENASFTVSGRTRYLSEAPASGSFEFDVSPQLAFFAGRREISGVINLTAHGVANYSEIKLEFDKAGDKVEKSTWVRVNQLVQPASANLLSGYSCGGATRINFTYDSGLLASGSGWVGCREIPLVVDPIFPADAVPVYVENSTGNSECRITADQQLQWDLSDVNCFELDEETAKYNLAEIPGFKSFVLKYNALRPACASVQGNSVLAQNTTLKLSCPGRVNSAGQLGDPLEVKVTVLNASGRQTKALDFHPLLSTYQAREFVLDAGAVYFYPVPSTPTPAGAPTNCPSGSTLVRVTQDKDNRKLFTDVFEYSTGQWKVEQPNGIYNRIYTQADCNLKDNSAGSFCAGFGIYADLLKIGKPVYNADATLLCKTPAPLTRSFAELSTDFRILLGGITAQSQYSSVLGRNIQQPYLSGQGNDTDFHLQCEYCAVSTLASANKQPPLGEGYAFAIAAPKNFETELSPQVWAAKDNLQKLGPARENLQFVYPASAAAAPVQLTDLGSASAIAVSSALVTGGKLSLVENSAPLADDVFSPQDDLLSKIYSPDGHTIAKPVLGYSSDAAAILHSTALRRSSGIFYCQAGGRNPANPAECRPTLADWVKIVPNPILRSESCQVCQSGVNCDSTCNAATQRYPDGRFCGNFCAAPQCYDAGECVGGLRTTPVGSRTTQSWENTSQLEAVQLSIPDENAPLKYFVPELQRFANGAAAFNYTEIVNLGTNCRDTKISAADGSGNCFAPGSIRASLSNFAPTPEQAESMLKLSEKVGGCEYSTKWGRGFYKVTFTYGLQPSGQWQWQYSAEPLELSATYLQVNDKCASPTLRTGERSQLCYYTFATNSAESGQCVRSLRDYIPRTFDGNLDFARNQYPENLIAYSTTGGTNIAGDEGVYAFTDKHAGPLRLEHPDTVSGSTYRYVRDLDLYSSNSLKCDAFSSQPLLGGKIPIVMLSSGSSLPLDARQTYITTFGLAGTDALPNSFGVDKRGKLDYFRQVSTQDNSVCSQLFHPRGEGAISVGRDLKFAFYNLQGYTETATQGNLCAVACYVGPGDGCPYVYSFDGSEYRFEHQAFPASGLEIEENYSYSALRFAKPQDGRIKIRSMQVLPETSYTNAIKVFAIDSPHHLTIIPDVNGVHHSIAKFEQPTSAVDQNGISQLSLVRGEDKIYWQPEEKGVSYLDVGFGKGGNAKLYVVLSRAEALSEELSSIRAAIGDNYIQTVMAVINALPRPVFNFIYTTWVKRKMALSVQLEENGKWVERASLRVGEPTYRLVYLPNVQGKIRLQTEGGYALDYAAADFSPDENLTVTELRLAGAINDKKIPVDDLLRADDGKRLAQTPLDYVDLEFGDAPLKAGQYRYYSLAIKGYSVPLAGNNQTLSNFLQQAPLKIASGVFAR